MTTELVYRPNRACNAILDEALRYVHSVPYKVTARWLFYRLHQAGVYGAKDDYKARFLGLITRARKAFYGGWAPDTLADDTRDSLYRGFGYSDALDWLEREVYRQGCKLDKWHDQPHYVEIWFEAAAMRSQFEYYTKHVTLRPFKGDPSLDFKWGIAKWLERVADGYPGKPITILYFGDLDHKGLQIPQSAADDIRAWCAAPFEFLRCGLNPGDEKRFNLPENFDKPGTYQWEALGDEYARSLIVDNLTRYIVPALFDETEEEEQRVTARFQQEMGTMVERWRKDGAA